jgi:predicted deacylase
MAKTGRRNKIMTMQPLPVWRDQTEGHFFTQIPVTRVLSGPLSLGLHVLTGRVEGPTLGILGVVHGDETLPPMVFRSLLQSLKTAEMAGRLVILPVANPLSMGIFNRQTPEQHGNTDLHTVFPGNPKGNLTQKLAAVIKDHLLDQVDALVDVHSGGSGGRLQNRTDLHEKAPENVREASFRLCRAFGSLFIHLNDLDKTAPGYVNSRGLPTCSAEVGGAYLGPGVTEDYIQRMEKGLRGIMIEMGMLPKEKSAPPPRQLTFNLKSRLESNPTVGGFLRSFYEKPEDLGIRLAKGARLGEIVDLFSLEVTEELVAPADGYLFFSRYSGVVDAGTKAFAIAAAATSRWMD